MSPGHFEHNSRACSVPAKTCLALSTQLRCLEGKEQIHVKSDRLQALMADPDPETEALLRHLHRELNGLTRGRRGSALQTQAEPLKRRRGSESSSASPPLDLVRGQVRSHSADGSNRQPVPDTGNEKQLKRLHRQSALAKSDGSPAGGRPSLPG